MKEHGNLIEISTCEVCGGTELHPVLNLGLHPMCDDLVEVGNDRVCKEYPIEILYCKTCNTAHQKYQIPKAELFPKTYHYRSRFTADVLNGMKGLVADCEKYLGSLQGKKVIDIGCNDGSLLDFFREKGAETIGIEPTDAYLDAKEKGHRVYNEFLTDDVAKIVVAEAGKPDIITFTNVFAHIENLKGVLDALKVMLKPETIIVVENHYLGSVLKSNQFDTFYHEHPRTYSYTSFEHIAKSMGLSVLTVEFPSRYGGNIRVVMGNKDLHNIPNENQQEVLDREKKFFDDFAKMRADIEVWEKEMKQTINDAVEKNGKLKAKAFPGRAAILIKLLGLDNDKISAAYEKNGSMKVGHYLPGTRIPILADDDLFKTLADEKVILNNAWHIKKEIANYLESNGFKGTIINILDNNN
ncbi:MAG: class I SAM-dependent methyltransferase [Ignavibacteria bacterium]|nr:class I SAM-dependent methyltransferase [Ignavibacteria bacterium]